MLQRLKSEHRQILRIMERIETTLFPANGADVVPIGEARWETEYMLRDHFAFKDAFVFRVLARSGRPKAVVTGRRLQAAGATIRQAYRNHLARWGPADMQTSWAAYRAASLDMIQQLRDLIELEKAELYPILESEAAVERIPQASFFGSRVAAAG